MLEISNLNSYVKVQDMQNRAAAQKEQEVDYTSAAPKEDEDSKPDIGVMVISAKLNRGQKLTGGEMEYLRKKSPPLYRKAQNIEDARCKLEKQLRNCKSKQEVRALRMCVTQSAVLDGTDAASGTEGSSGMMYHALDNEWSGFVDNKTYKKLPERAKPKILLKKAQTGKLV